MMKIKRSKFNLLIILILTFQLLYPVCSMYYKYGDQNKNAKPQTKPASASGGGYDMFNDNYSWIEIKDSGIRLSISNYDDSYDVIHLASWNFEFYKKNFSSIYVSSNGWISLTNLGDIGWLPGFIPSYNIENYYCIALLAEDLDPSYGGDIYYEFFGTSPNRYIVIEYYHVYDYYNWQFIGDFEVILKENGDVTFQYKNVNNLDYFYPLIGIDYGDLANYNRFDANFPISNLAITFKFNEISVIVYIPFLKCFNYCFVSVICYIVDVVIQFIKMLLFANYIIFIFTNNSFSNFTNIICKNSISIIIISI